jgi:transcriptional regulator with XRE-family HTH domain
MRIFVLEMAVKTKAKRKGKEELESLKRLAYEFFMGSDKTQKEIAGIVGISEPTMVSWVELGKWDELRSFEKASNASQIKRIKLKIFALTDPGAKGDEGKNADAAAKWAAVLAQLEQKKVSIPNMINVFKQFDSWLFSDDPELAKAVSVKQNKFLIEQANG